MSGSGRMLYVNTARMPAGGIFYQWLISWLRISLICLARPGSSECPEKHGTPIP